MGKLDSDSSDSDEDLGKIAIASRKKASVTNNSASPPSHSPSDPITQVVLPLSPKKKVRASSKSSSSSSMRYTTVSSSSSSSTSASASATPSSKLKNASQYPPKPPPKTPSQIQRDEELWDDDDDEITANLPTPATVKEEKEKNKANGNNKKTTSKVNSSMLAMINEDEDDISSGDEAENYDTLYPTISGYAQLGLGAASSPTPFSFANSSYSVPGSINRYLRDYQRAGVEFMADRIINSSKGSILGDDMGLGKTIQVIALLAAILEKVGKKTGFLSCQSNSNAARFVADRD